MQPPRSTTAFPRRALAILFLAVAATVLVAWLLGSFRPVAPISSAVDASPPTTLAALASPPASAGSSSAAPSRTADGASSSPAGTSSTGPAAADPVLIGTGDIARCDTNGDEQTAQLVARNEGIVFTLGDNAYENGSPAEFRDCYDPTWGQVKDRTELPVAGNHDYGTRNAAGYRDYFGSKATPEGETWYSRDIGDWHVVVLDANCTEVGGCGPGSPQLQWLSQDLRESTARCTLAMWHQPRFSSGEHGNDPTVAPFWNELYDAGADLILNGHDHDYERFAPQDPNGNRDPDRGIVEIVVGTGGGETRDLGPSVAANSIVRQARLLGVIQVTLHADSWSWQFLSTDGSFTDSGDGSCH